MRDNLQDGKKRNNITKKAFFFQTLFNKGHVQSTSSRVFTKQGKSGCKHEEIKRQMFIKWPLHPSSDNFVFGL